MEKKRVWRGGWAIRTKSFKLEEMGSDRGKGIVNGSDRGKGIVNEKRNNKWE